MREGMVGSVDHWLGRNTPGAAVAATASAVGVGDRDLGHLWMIRSEPQRGEADNTHSDHRSLRERGLGIGRWLMWGKRWVDSTTDFGVSHGLFIPRRVFAYVAICAVFPITVRS
jgi:hypothetical protein